MGFHGTDLSECLPLIEWDVSEEAFHASPQPRIAPGIGPGIVILFGLLPKLAHSGRRSLDILKTRDRSGTI